VSKAFFCGVNLIVI